MTPEELEELRAAAAEALLAAYIAAVRGEAKR